MRKYKTGDVVQLITGGPKMTVIVYEAPINWPGEFKSTENNTVVTCQWWDENSQEFRQQPFNQDTLRKIEEF